MQHLPTAHVILMFLLSNPLFNIQCKVMEVDMCSVFQRSLSLTSRGIIRFHGPTSITAKDLDVHLQLVIGCQLKSYQGQATRAVWKVAVAAKDRKARKYS